MASLYKKIINGKPYYYLREMARVDGKPKMVSERYLGSAADIVAAMDRAEAGMMPERTRHLRFGDVAAVWSLLTDLDVAGVIDDVVGARRADAGASVGHVPGVGRVGPAGGAAVQERFRRLLGRHRRGPVHQDQREGAGPPQVLGRHARRGCHQRCRRSRPGWRPR